MTEGTAVRGGAPWRHAFEITGADGDELVLRQISAKGFALGRGGNHSEGGPTHQPPEVTIRYRSEWPTGLEKFVDRDETLTPEVFDQIRCVDSHTVGETDLASVPGPMRWFTNTYGAYTPAALIHDWLIPNKGDPAPPIREEYSDRYFRYMLGAVGVPLFKRYIMWGAVAVRTRAKSPKWWRPLLLGLWALTSATGLSAFVVSVLALLFGSWTPFGVDPVVLLGASAVAPFVFCWLWGRQFGAGIVAAFAAPWVLPAAAFAGFGYVVYYALETLAEAVIVPFLSDRGSPSPSSTSGDNAPTAMPAQGNA